MRTQCLLIIAAIVANSVYAVRSFEGAIVIQPEYNISSPSKVFSDYGMKLQLSQPTDLLPLEFAIFSQKYQFKLADSTAILASKLIIGFMKIRASQTRTLCTLKITEIYPIKILQDEGDLKKRLLCRPRHATMAWKLGCSAWATRHGK